MAEENLFDQVRVNNKRLEEIERFVKGVPEWNQPGLLTLLQAIQAKQASQDWRLLLLSILVGLLLVLCLAILVLLIIQVRGGM